MSVLSSLKKALRTGASQKNDLEFYGWLINILRETPRIISRAKAVLLYPSGDQILDGVAGLML